MPGTYDKSCGCLPDGVYVEFCPLHAAAPDMRDALEDLLLLIESVRNLYPGNHAGRLMRLSASYAKSRAALAKAKGGA